MGAFTDDMPFDLRLVSRGVFHPLRNGGGISVVSIASASEALALVDRKLLALLGCEILNAAKHGRRPSSMTSSSDDSTFSSVGSTRVSVGGIVQTTVG